VLHNDKWHFHNSRHSTNLVRAGGKTEGKKERREQGKGGRKQKRKQERKRFIWHPICRREVLTAAGGGKEDGGRIHRHTAWGCLKG
jgi:hypothetical protein